MKSWLERGLPYAALVLATAGATLVVVRARAAGIPDADLLTYTGYLEDGDGGPLTGDHSIEVELFDAVDGASELCGGGSSSVSLQSGRFQVALPAECVAAVKGNVDVWVDVKVDGASLGRTKLGAVPFAIEAGHASSADEASAAAGGLEDRLADMESQLQVRSAFRARPSAAQTAPQNVLTKMTMGVEDFDDGDEYDPTTSTFTAKQAGTYITNCRLRYESGSPGVVGWWAVTLLMNGASQATDGFYGDGFTASRAVTATVKLEAGDELTCAAYHELSGNRTIIPTLTGFDAVRVGD